MKPHHPEPISSVEQAKERLYTAIYHIHGADTDSAQDAVNVEIGQEIDALIAAVSADKDVQISALTREIEHLKAEPRLTREK